MDFDRVFLLGHLVKDVRFIEQSNGKKYAFFRLAVNRKYQKDNELQTSTVYLNIITNGNTAEFCRKNLTRGSQVFIEGRHSMKEYEKDSISYTVIEIFALTVVLLNKKVVEKGDNPEPPLPTVSTIETISPAVVNDEVNVEIDETTV